MVARGNQAQARNERALSKEKLKATRSGVKMKSQQANLPLGQRVVDTVGGAVMGGRVKNDMHQAHNGQPAENHGLLKLPSGQIERASYMGPGTHVIERLKKGDRGKTAVDRVAKIHDIDYMLARKPSDVAVADKRMIDAVKRVSASNKDSQWNIAQANLMKPKYAVEKVLGANRLRFANLGQVGDEKVRNFLMSMRK
jgi:hypothetical protein